MQRTTSRIGVRLLGTGLAVFGLALCTRATPAWAQSPVAFSPDITAVLGSVGPAVVADDDAAIDDAAGSVTPILVAMLAALPESAAVAGFELSSVAGPLLSVETSLLLPALGPPLAVEPRDVVAYAAGTATFSLVFDGSLSGVPAGACIDAVALDSGGATLLLSFDIAVSLPVVGPVEDEDVVGFTAGIFSMVFDGSLNGVAAGLDVDAAYRDPTSDILQLSFDGSGSVFGVGFDDEDVLAFDLTTATWAVFADSSLSDPLNWPAADLVALPEPGSNAALAAGAALLAWLRRRRRRAPRGSGEARGIAPPGTRSNPVDCSPTS